MSVFIIALLALAAAILAAFLIFTIVARRALNKDRRTGAKRNPTSIRKN